MKRLTNAREAAAQRRAYEKRLEQGYPRNIPEERFLKLAAYEDTGLEPEEIDAVPVVRCRECRKWNSDPDSYGQSDGPKGKCMKTFEVTSDDDFCSYGERKDGAE